MNMSMTMTMTMDIKIDIEMNTYNFPAPGSRNCPDVGERVPWNMREAGLCT
jgi:hypothetical protein